MFTIDEYLSKYGEKIFSQNDEDGIIKYLTETLTIEKGYFVEFGVGPPHTKSIEECGLEANCRLLREKGWDGLFMDGADYPELYQVKKEFVTTMNINRLLIKYNCPEEIDIISIDVDGQDFWIWMNLERKAKIIIIEYNRDFEPDESYVVNFGLDHCWDGTRYMGASLRALCKLGESKGYRPVYANGVNVFFVREDLIFNQADFPYFIQMPRSFLHQEDHHNRPWTKV